jgi:hypothetical protein
MQESVVFMRKHMTTDELTKYADATRGEISKWEKRMKDDPKDKVNRAHVIHFRRILAKIISVLEARGVFIDGEVAVRASFL